MLGRLERSEGRVTTQRTSLSVSLSEVRERLCHVQVVSSCRARERGVSR
jgi:hypothetical protein